MMSESGMPVRAGRLAALAGVLAVVVLLVGFAQQSTTAAAQRSSGLTGTEVLAALEASGLAVEAAREQPVGGAGPSGPPGTEREAWGFVIPSVAPSGGRVLVFEDDDKLQRKAAWFRRAGSTIIAHRNVLLWLDPSLDPRDVAAYRQALHAL